MFFRIVQLNERRTVHDALEPGGCSKKDYEENKVGIFLSSH